MARKIVTFGHFGGGNFGNEATLAAMLQGLRDRVPDSEFTCICAAPEKVKADYGIAARPNRDRLVTPWAARGRVIRLIRKVLVGVPSELWCWLQGFKSLRRTDAVIVPGTGLLTDAYTMYYWGPYDMLRWSLTAKLCGCKLLFVSVGAGPLYSRVARSFIRTALSLADFRSYRDVTTQQYLLSIGFPAGRDPVYPDLAFSLSYPVLQKNHSNERRRPVVGLGIMEYAGRYSVEKPTGAIPSAYMQSLAVFGRWLLDHGYDLRLLIGDLVDRDVVREFKSLLLSNSAPYDAPRVIDEPVESVAELLSQLASTDFVVATRFHNVLLSIFLNKPTIAIAFHHKCSSLMSQMGLADYCQDINHLHTDDLIKQFRRLEANAEKLRALMAENVKACREALDEQYAVMLSKLWPEELRATIPVSAMDVRPGSGNEVRS